MSIVQTPLAVTFLAPQRDGMPPGTDTSAGPIPRQQATQVEKPTPAKHTVDTQLVLARAEHRATRSAISVDSSYWLG